MDDGDLSAKEIPFSNRIGNLNSFTLLNFKSMSICIEIFFIKITYQSRHVRLSSKNILAVRIDIVSVK